MSVMQGYAFVEYSVPNGALKCKEGMDKIEAEMRPDFRRKACIVCACAARLLTPVCLYMAQSAGKFVRMTQSVCKLKYTSVCNTRRQSSRGFSFHP
jgi:hypothetical protein